MCPIFPQLKHGRWLAVLYGSVHCCVLWPSFPQFAHRPFPWDKPAVGAELLLTVVACDLPRLLPFCSPLRARRAASAAACACAAAAAAPAPMGSTPELPFGIVNLPPLAHWRFRPSACKV